MKLCIDTFRHPYVELAEPIAFPPVTLESPDPDSALELKQTLADLALPWFRIPLAPPPFADRDSTTLTLGQEVSHDHDLACFLLIRIKRTFLGGEGSPARKQGVSPAFRSPRVYFQAYLLPLSANGGNTPLTYSAAENFSFQKEQATGWFRPTALFDSPDFGHFNRDLSSRFACGGNKSFFSLLLPFQIEYGCVAHFLLAPFPAAVAHAASFYLRLLRSLRDNTEPDPETTDYWRNHYDSYEYSRILSPSGNPHWCFHRFPGAAHMQHDSDHQ